MYKIQSQIRLQLVHYYLNNGVTLMQTARKFNVHYQSVFKWVKWYQKQGEERLLSNDYGHWNRTEKVIEEKVVFLKENDSTLTGKKAKQILEKNNIKI